MNGINVLESGVLLRDRDMKVTTTGDFDGDGKADLIWYNPATGETSIWLMSGTRVVTSTLLLADTAWHVVKANDFNGDGKTDLVWSNGIVSAIVVMNGTQQILYRELRRDADWKVVSTADYKEGIFLSAIQTGEGYADLLWKNTATHETAAWAMSSVSFWRSRSLGADPNWSVTALPDFDGDGRMDLLWTNDIVGFAFVWMMDGLTPSSYTWLSMDANWRHVTPGR